MNFEEFDEIVRTSAEDPMIPEDLEEELAPAVATADQLATVERELGATLPQAYKEFMLHYGAGDGLPFYVEVVPVISPWPYQQGLLELNRSEGFRGDSEEAFVAFAEDGSGDFWGFRCVGGVCGEEVYRSDHEAKTFDQESPGFFEFMITKGLRQSL